ncbi:dynein light chain Tctex-type protein 2B-like isoform X1 [Littorina saxatilis]|uniref:dynein light chain Tctex-type protein 2B-like isoform X1 n=1 Tax=Littorina saxatilis TaxID=31220 RepID=UPI0038B68BAE
MIVISWLIYDESHFKKDRKVNIKVNVDLITMPRVQIVSPNANMFSKRQRLFSTGGAPSETARRRTTSVLSDNAPKVTSPNKSSMSIFRLVAATRTWQRLAKRKREAAVPIRLENTYQLEPDARTRFSPSKVEAILKEVLESRLRNVNYNPEQCRRVTTDLATIIKNRAKKLEFQRYKLVCNVLIMENKGQGSQVVSRGLTNTDTDSFAAYTYRNPSLIAVANVHGIYYE